MLKISELVLPEYVGNSSALNLNLKSGSICRVLGRSGVGKTSLLRTVMGAENPWSGDIMIEGQSPRAFVQANPGALSMVPQFPAITTGSLLQNITLLPKHGASNCTSAEDVLTLMENVGLGTWAKGLEHGLHTEIHANSLSGGQKQRIGIARALFTNPRYLLLDEPFSALDEEAKTNLARWIVNLGLTIMFVSHDSKKWIQWSEEIRLE